MRQEWSASLPCLSLPLRELALCSKCKLYRFDKESGSGEWKERGVGQVRLLEHKGNKKIRLLMRQEKTLKIRANHIGAPSTTVHA